MSEKTDFVNDLLKFQDTFSRKRLAELITERYPGITETNINWKIHRLIKSGKISRCGRGLYTVNTKNDFVPVLNQKTRDVAVYITNKLPYLEFTAWDTFILNYFLHNLTFRNQIIIETEKEFCESLFFTIREKYENTYLKPDTEMMYRYFDGKEAIIIIPEVKQAPLIKINGINTITAEKIITDILANKYLNFIFGGKESEKIIKELLSGFNINMNKLKRYSKRRNVWNKVQRFFKVNQQPF